MGRKGKGREEKGREGKGRERKGKERKGKERKGKERKGKERKGKERKGRERKGKDTMSRRFTVIRRVKISLPADKAWWKSANLLLKFDKVKTMRTESLSDVTDATGFFPPS